jgi:glucan phosphoethanolaminetransferase (alkaline phosphatase superfamily)
MEKLRSLKPNIFFHLFVNVVVVIFITGASYYHTPLEGFKDKAIYLLHLFILQTTVAGIIYFLSLIKWVFRIVFPTLFLLYCCFSFWSYSQDVSVTSGLIQAVFESTSDIVIDVITLPYILFFLAALIAVYLVLKFYSRIEPRKGIFGFSIIALSCIGLYFVTENKRNGTLKNRLPYNAIYGLKGYYKTPDLKLNTEIKPIVKEKDSITLVFVLGETVRADHLSLNGYKRETTPLLEKEPNIISFTKLYTEHTYTGKSVPQILTNQNLGDPDQPLTSVFTVANKAEIETTWIGNQTLEESFAPITKTNNSILLVDKFKSDLSFNKELDEVMLQPLDSVIKTHNSQLITLHMIGSHWWYENRYSDRFRKFTPVIDSKYVPSQSSEQMINSYDNTILYLDYFLSEVIQKLKKKETPTVLVYVSDHGELLGEDGRWLHAQGGDALKNPAYLFWFSDSYIKKYGNEVEALSEIKELPITTNDVYYRLLDILGIKTQ